MSFHVYLIRVEPSDKVYIGYTAKGVEARFKAHWNNARDKRPGALYSAIRKYGRQSMSVHVLAEVTTHAEACELERQHISLYSCMAKNGYNLTSGGDGVPISREAIERGNEKRRASRTPKQLAYWASRKGTKASPETRALLSKIRTGRKQSAQWVENRVSKLRGRKMRDARQEALL